jgi:DNA-binding transcriptional ArsR family regulator
MSCLLSAMPSAPAARSNGALARAYWYAGTATGRLLAEARISAYRDEVIELRMAADDFTRLRLGYSPLAEAIDSLSILQTGRVHPLHRRWANDTRHRLRGLDTTLLWAITPPRPVALTPPLDLSTAASIPRQLRLIADWPPDQLRAQLGTVWRGLPMPAAAQDVISDGPAGARRLAAALAKPASRTYDVTGKGLLLMPSIFGGMNLSYDLAGPGMPLIAYSPRGLGVVWETNGASADSDDPVSALMGKGRTAILRSTRLPATTTDLARELQLSGATVSVHLSTLKRCGMVTSWRCGRRVFYQRTPLASSILAAASMSAG